MENLASFELTSISKICIRPYENCYKNIASLNCRLTYWMCCIRYCYFSQIFLYAFLYIQKCTLSLTNCCKVRCAGRQYVVLRVEGTYTGWSASIRMLCN